VAVRRGQDDLPGPRAVGRRQDELLFGNAGRLHRRRSLDLLTRLPVGYNLTAALEEEGDGERKGGKEQAPAGRSVLKKTQMTR